MEGKHAAAKTVAIVGAGMSGLLVCKYVLEAGLRPLVFEADSDLGGVWARTFESTKLQAPPEIYRFTDHPWPENVPNGTYPESSLVLEYLRSYAWRFGLLEHVRFDSRVVCIDYTGPTMEDMKMWELWSGTGGAFGGGGGRWHVTVRHHKGDESSMVYQVDFLILCIGRFSGLPNMPSFPPNKGPEVFKGKVLHSMDYSNIDNSSAAALLKGKRVTIVGFSKSAVDIAAECSVINGTANPCTMMYRESRWIVPDYSAWGIPLNILYLNRFAELLVHKPGEGFLLYALASVLSPLRWLISKLVEGYLMWKLPLRKFGAVPSHSFFQEMSASKVALLPEGFYRRVEEGSIILKRSPRLSFCEDGLVAVDDKLVASDLVIFATGFDGARKIREIFKSTELQEVAMGSSSIMLPLYRGCIHPRIPQLAIVGYSESLSNVLTSEMQCMWLGRFLGGGFRLPAIRRMEEDVVLWEKYMEDYCGGNSSIGSVHTWYVDKLFRDMGMNPRRKKGLISDWFAPYMPLDYAKRD